MHGPIWMLYGLIGWLAIIPSLAGIAVCIRYFNRSRWIPLLLGGFALEVALSVLQRLASLAIGEGVPASSTSVGLAFAFGSALAVVANAAVVCGVGGLLYDMGAKEAKSRTVD